MPAASFHTLPYGRGSISIDIGHSAELIEQKTDVRIATRVSELSLHGCYLDMMNPFPKDTLVLVKIFAGEDFFPALLSVYPRNLSTTTARR